MISKVLSTTTRRGPFTKTNCLSLPSLPLKFQQEFSRKKYFNTTSVVLLENDEGDDDVIPKG